MTFFIVIGIIGVIIYGLFFEKPLADKKVKKYEEEQRKRGL